MASKDSTVKKSGAGPAKNGGAGPAKNSGAGNKPRISAQQRKMRRQQVGMAIFALILVVAMILSLVIR
jgi:hypothetical protein